MIRKFLPLLMALSFGTLTHADEADVRKGMEARLGTKVDGVTKAGYFGLYEVYAGGEIFYTDDKMAVIIAGGNLIDTKTMKNLTKERQGKLSAIKFSELPLERAIKQVRGDGKRVIATFEDPNCGYCKRLARDLQKLDNVTVYTFLLPILSQDSDRKSNQIWCATDRAKAWNDWMIDGRAPTGREDCDTTAISRNKELGRRLGIHGTPTIFFTDGVRVPGALPLQGIEDKLAELAR